MALKRDQLLAPRSLHREAVKVPELAQGEDDEIFISMMDGVSLDAWERWCQKNAQDKDGKPKQYIDGTREALVCFTAVDSEGVRLFSETDIDLLRKWPGAVTERLARVAQRINRIGVQALEDTKGN